MIENIKTIEDVKKFTKDIIEEGVNFHPDTDFNDYISITTNKPFYTRQEAEFRNDLVNQCFKLCERKGIEIYEITCNVFWEVTGLNKAFNIV